MGDIGLAFREEQMITIALKCVHCQSKKLVRNGHAPNGKQKYTCRSCGRHSRENPTPNAYSLAEREQILRTYPERSSLRGRQRTFGLARNTVTAWIKKVADLPALSQPLANPKHRCY